MNNSSRTVVTVYNRYLMRGGEDEVFESEADLLRSHGWRVVPITDATQAPRDFKDAIKLGADSIWSTTWYSRFRSLVRRFRPSIVHVHNVFPVISPSIFYAARAEGAAIVHTLHNYRLVCPNAMCFRDGHVCEDCVSRAVPWPGVLHACYRKNRTQTASVAAMLSIHHQLRTWKDKIDTFVVLTEFARRLFLRGGLPADKVVVKPNFVYPDPGYRRGDGRYCLFVGRLASQKGVLTMLRAWRNLSDVPLKVIGDPTSPREGRKVAQMGEVPNVEFVGRVSRGEVISLLGEARLLVFPSESYESFPLSIAEAFACGVPVICTQLGAMAEIVDRGRTGLQFEAGNPDDLARTVRWAWEHPDELRNLGRQARAEYEARYTAARNYEMLVEIYDQASRIRKGRS